MHHKSWWVLTRCLVPKLRPTVLNMYMNCGNTSYMYALYYSEREIEYYMCSPCTFTGITHSSRCCWL